jgi:Protein-disulfide isomerase
MQLSHLLVAAAVAVTPFIAKAAPPSTSDGADAIRASVESLGGRGELQAVRKAPVAGLMEVQADGEILYFTPDGKYLIAGDIYRVADRANLTEGARGKIRVAQLATSDASTHISYGPKDANHVIYVFTDISCGYCQQWHQQVPALNAAGVRVEYLAWPRGGARSPDVAKMDSIWCAKDRRAAYDAAIAGKSVASASCKSPVMAQYDLGERIGVQGTPAIFAADGRQLGGYIPAKAILQALSVAP